MSWKAVLMEPGERDAMSGLLTTVFGRGPRPSEAVQREIDLVIEPGAEERGSRGATGATFP